MQSDQIQITYYFYHIRIRTQSSDTDTETDIDEYEKNDTCIRQNQISDTDRIRILIGYAKTNTVTDKHNIYTYILWI